ncbi:MAG: hypothetical protein J4G14_07855 [Dehalococcoidia bacterium]|nr:hypothetical protein [Dehalococcoidia bacterium]
MRLWPFAKRARKLTNQLQHALLMKFGVQAGDSFDMRYVSKRGRLGSGPVTRVCIFNPTLLSAPELAKCTYENLMDLGKGLLFTGHILESIEFSSADSVILYDRRA